MTKTPFKPINIHEIFEKIGRPQEMKESRMCGLCGQFELDSEFAAIAIPSVGRICSQCHRTLEKEVLFIEKLQELRGQALKNVFTSDQDDFIMVSDE